MLISLAVANVVPSVIFKDDFAGVTSWFYHNKWVNEYQQSCWTMCCDSDFLEKMQNGDTICCVHVIIVIFCMEKELDPFDLKYTRSSFRWTHNEQCEERLN